MPENTKLVRVSDYFVDVAKSKADQVLPLPTGTTRLTAGFIVGNQDGSDEHEADIIEVYLAPTTEDNKAGVDVLVELLTGKLAEALEGFVDWAAGNDKATAAEDELTDAQPA